MLSVESMYNRMACWCNTQPRLEVLCKSSHKYVLLENQRAVLLFSSWPGLHFRLTIKDVLIPFDFSACNFTFTFVCCKSTLNHFQFAMPKTSALPFESVPSSWKEPGTWNISTAYVPTFDDTEVQWIYNGLKCKQWCITQKQINRINRNKSGGAKLNNTTVCGTNISNPIVLCKLWVWTMFV